MKGGAAQKVTGTLLALALAEEVGVEPGQPAWRTGENGTRLGLKLTCAGLDAIGIGDEEGTGAEGRSEADLGPKVDTALLPEQAGPRPGSKQAQVVSLLRRETGVTLDELVAATGWLPHTTRAALTGLRQRGYEIGKRKDEEGRTVYCIVDPGEGRAGEGAGSVAG